jgi:PAS domain S-box-containing protein
MCSFHFKRNDMDLLSFLSLHGDRFTFPVSLALYDEKDQPLRYVNESFQKMVVYERDEILGRNCRFLQNGKGESEARERIRTAIKGKEAVCQDLVNYRKTGELFYNRLVMVPILTRASGFILGLQHEIPLEKYNAVGAGSQNEIIDRLLNPVSLLLSLPSSDEDIFEKEFRMATQRIRDYVLSL